MVAPEQVRLVVEPVLGTFGMELVDVESGPGGLRVVVDRGDGGLDLDTLAEATRLVFGALDENETAGPKGSYTLEVSSPGIERVLRTPEHFRRFVGATVAIKTRPGTSGDRRIEGRLIEADAQAIVVEVTGRTDARRRLAYDQIERARTVLQWGPAVRPGKGKTRPGGGSASTARPGGGSASTARPGGGPANSAAPRGGPARVATAHWTADAR